jgi:hypothetical protein
MNLTMPPEVVGDLANRGRSAGALLAERFGPTPPADVELTWHNHRWVRYRSTMALLERTLASYAAAYRNPEPDPSYADLVRRDQNTPPAGYRWRRVADAPVAGQMTDHLIDLADTWAKTSTVLHDGAPAPRPELRIVPRF